MEKKEILPWQLIYEICLSWISKITKTKTKNNDKSTYYNLKLNENEKLVKMWIK